VLPVYINTFYNLKFRAFLEIINLNVIFLLNQPELVDKLIVEDIAPTVSVSTGIPEAVAAMKNISFTDKSLTSIARARHLANELLMKNFPVSRICSMDFQTGIRLLRYTRGHTVMFMYFLE
jgi:hypothetical protein